jgi:hypothetical protein
MGPFCRAPSLLMPRTIFLRLLPRAAAGLGLLLSGCGHALPNIPDFQAAAWQADAYGCQGRRAALVAPLLAARTALYETRADDITALLGHPDEEELQVQTEKVYYYYLAPGPQCGPRHPHSGAPRLSLHFGPLGTVTEIQADPVLPATSHALPQ